MERDRAQRDEGDDHRQPSESALGQGAEHRRREPGDRKERPVVQIGLAVDQKPFDIGDVGGDGKPAAQEGLRLYIVEITREPSAIEQTPWLPFGQQEREEHRADDRDDLSRSLLDGGDAYGATPHVIANEYQEEEDDEASPTGSIRRTSNSNTN